MLLRSFCRRVATLFFREVAIEGKGKLPESGSAIFTPNHPNGLVDPLLLFFLSPPFDIRFVAKEPLFRIPLLGAILKSLRSIPVVRRFEASGKVDYRAFFASCVEALRNGESIAIFPEGVSLPQSYLAPLKTGPARLFFQARENGIPVKIIPIGLNYEQGPIFRSSVLVLIAEPVDTEQFEARYREDPADAIRGLTDSIAETLAGNVLQAESYRDKELMILLERLSSERHDDDWSDRFVRLKGFERALNQLRSTCGTQIDRLRNLLDRYRKLSERFEIPDSPPEYSTAAGNTFFDTIGWIPAVIGWIFNALPYYFVDLLVRIAHHDESAAATYKIVYSVFAFPIFYLLETYGIFKAFGWIFAFIFLAGIVPLSIFTLHFFERREQTYAQRIARNPRAVLQMEKLRLRILKEFDALANRKEIRQDSDGPAN